MDQAGFEQRLRAMEAANEALAGEIASLRSQMAALTDDGPSQPSAEPPAGPAATEHGRGPSRRALLGGAVAGAAAAVTGVLSAAQPAAASTGTMQYGASNNAAGSETTLISTSASSTLVVSNGSGAGLASTTNSGDAIRGSATSGTGVHAISSSGNALRAEANGHGWGAYISSAEDVALVVDSPRSHLMLAPGSRIAPTTDTKVHYIGELIFDRDGNLWACTDTGTPGTWTKVGGRAAAGVLHLLPSPVRIYDSRPATQPSTGPKAPLDAAEVRTLDASAAGAVPPGATGAVLTCMVINADSPGNFTVWAAGVAKPSANSMVWGGTDGRHSTLAMTAVSGARKISVSSSIPTDVVVDVVGYYR